MAPFRCFVYVNILLCYFSSCLLINSSAQLQFGGQKILRTISMSQAATSFHRTPSRLKRNSRSQPQSSDDSSSSEKQLCAAQKNNSFEEILDKNTHTTKFVFFNETNGNITVTKTGEDDNIVIVVTFTKDTQSSLYRSTDGGKSFENATSVLRNLSVSELQKNEISHYQFILIATNLSSDDNRTWVLVTNDGGLTFNISKLPFQLVGKIIFHPFIPDWCLALGQNGSKTSSWLSTKQGLQWKQVYSDVTEIQWGTGFVDNNETFFILRRKNPTEQKPCYDLLKSSNLGKNFTVISSMVKNFEMKGKFIYASVYTNEDKDKSILRVSTNGGKNWNEAQLPTIVEDQFYRILDMSEGMVFIHVDHQGDTGHGTLYTSDTDGIIFSESLKKHLYPNYEDVTDFYKVNSIRGVYLTNQLNDNRSVRTMVTYNRGATWQPVRKPLRSKCPQSVKECYLQMSSQFSLKKGVRVPMGPLSAQSAVGIVLTHGHVGLSLLLDDPDVFVSADGGYNWIKALTGPHLYAIADHGGLLVAIPGALSHPSANIINYSTDEGQTWCSYKFTSENIYVTGLLADPDTWSQKVVIWGYGVDDSVWRVTVIDFQPLLKRPCREPEDFESFMAHNELSAGDPLWQGCLLGIRETFRKLKQNAWCYLGQSYQVQTSKEPCNCTKDDFECDFGYYRPSGSDRCVENPVFKGAELDICLNGEEMEIITTGYRRIPGDRCVKGFDPGQHYRKDIKRKCAEGDKTLLGNFQSSHNSSIASAFLAALVIVITVLLIFMAVFFIKKCKQLHRSPLVYRYSRLTQEELACDSSNNIDEITQNSSLELENSSDDEQMQPATLLVDTSDTTTIDMKPQPVVKTINSSNKSFYFDESDDELLQ